MLSLLVGEFSIRVLKNFTVMNKSGLRILVFTAGVLAVVGCVVLPQIFVRKLNFKQSLHPVAKDKAQMAEVIARLPLSFELNQGQTDSSVKFLSRGPGYSIFVRPEEVVFSLPKRNSAIIRMQLRGANSHSELTGLSELPGKVNYFAGHDGTGWRTNIPTYAKVRAGSVYTGIDAIYYGNNRQLEYDFEVAPGVDPSVVRLGFDGSEGLSIDSNGDLVVKAAGDEIRLLKPVAYQDVMGSRQDVAAEYVLLDQQNVGFSLGRYNTDAPLVIDPTVVYATYLGGPGTDDAGSDTVDGIAVDGSGIYVTGFSASTSFPVVNGGYSGTLSGGQDVFVAKLNPSGSQLLYSTYIGGTNDDYGEGIALDPTGNAYVTGHTMSAGFPTTMGAAKVTISGTQDAFLLKLNSTGSGLLYSTYVGGNGDEAAYGIALDAANNAYITGTTTSTTGFSTVGAAQATYGGGTRDAFVAKLNAAGSAFSYVTYIGGSNDEDFVVFGTLVLPCAGIAVDSATGIAYVVGTTASSAGFPLNNARQGTYGGGGHDAFVAKLNAAGSAFTFSTYLGGAADDLATGVAIDASGNVYLTGATMGAFPIVAGGADDTFNAGFYDAFVSKLDTTGATLVYSTYLGGGAVDFGLGIAVDGSNNAYVVGLTQSTNFPTVSPTQGSLAGSLADAFISKVNPTGTALTYSTYFGGTLREFCRDITVVAGDIYIGGLTVSTDLPTVSPLQNAYAGGNSDGFIVKISQGAASKKVRAQTISQ